MNENAFLVVGLLAAAIAFGALARRLNLPYPIAFVVGGAALAFVPNLPRVEIAPDAIFLLVLPPLLYAGAWATDLREFKRNIRPIGLLAIGLVLLTTLVVAIVAHAMLPEMDWAAAFALGAIVSPPDAVAAIAIFERFTVPRRIVTILDGEGLVNDGTALVLLRFAIAAAVTGTFSLANASLAFVYVAVVGVALGVVVGAATVAVVRGLSRVDLDDAQIDNVTILLSPYAAYLLADGLGASGVLATVAAGLYVSRASSQFPAPETRLVGSAVWNLMIFLLNALVFIVIGLQLRQIVLDNASQIGRLVWIAVVLLVVMILVRFAWVYGVAAIVRPILARIPGATAPLDNRSFFLVGWTGMRGIVSLAAALALPYVTQSGAPFPARQEIIFITFAIIFATLVGQGLTLAPIVQVLGLHGDDIARREVEVRVRALEAGVARLRQLEAEFTDPSEWEIEGRIVAEYDHRIEHLRGHAGEEPESAESTFDHRLQNEALQAERAEIMRLRAAGEIPDEVFRRIEYDLDLAEARLT